MPDDNPKNDPMTRQKLSDDAINTLRNLRSQLRRIEDAYNNKNDANKDVHSGNSFTDDINTNNIEFPHR